MKSKTLLMMSSAIAVLASIGLLISVSYAQENMTSAANETGAIMENQTNQTGGNQTQQGPIEQLGEALGGIFGGGGNQSQ
ncbi:MAG: hypothetical protein M3264_00055 [Thermoproteota archaeon]|jgi:hypothetical protein|nr:hypothetical protein [Thermoproteota archaeon]